MKDITIIIPIAEFNEEIKKYAEKAIESIKGLNKGISASVVVSGSKENADAIVSLAVSAGIKSVDAVYCDGDMWEAINTAAMQCLTKYFSIMEIDDTFAPYWFDRVSEHIEDCKDTSLSLPICKLVDSDYKVLGLVNEIAWSAAFNENLGIIDASSLDQFMDFNVSGCVMRTDDFASVGGLKPSMKVAAWYEFLLRMVEQGKKICVVPRIGYIHMVNRPDSYSVLSSRNLPKDEARWLIQRAKDECKQKADSGAVFNAEEWNRKLRESEEGK